MTRSFTRSHSTRAVIRSRVSVDYDQLAIDGTATLEGLLQVLLVDGFVPSFDDEFTILTAEAGLQGFFLNAPPLDGVRPASPEEQAPAGFEEGRLDVVVLFSLDPSAQGASCGPHEA